MLQLNGDEQKFAFALCLGFDFLHLKKYEQMLVIMHLLPTCNPHFIFYVLPTCSFSPGSLTSSLHYQRTKSAGSALLPISVITSSFPWLVKCCLLSCLNTIILTDSRKPSSIAAALSGNFKQQVWLPLSFTKMFSWFLKVINS